MTVENETNEHPVVLGDTTEPVKFDERQQHFLDSILIPRAMGRAARDLRAELSTVKTKLAAAENALKAQSPDSSEVERLTALLRLAQAEVDAVKSASSEANTVADIERALHAADVLDPALLRTAIADRVQRVGNDYQILDEAGTVREGVTLQQFIDEEAAKRPYLVRGRTITGTGQGGSNGNAAIPQGIKCEQVFGKNSSSKRANDLAMCDKRTYDALRREAIAKGIL